jgi:hypothetical protein
MPEACLDFGCANATVWRYQDQIRALGGRLLTIHKIATFTRPMPGLAKTTTQPRTSFNVALQV